MGGGLGNGMAGKMNESMKRRREKLIRKEERSIDRKELSSEGDYISRLFFPVVFSRSELLLEKGFLHFQAYTCQ